MEAELGGPEGGEGRAAFFDGERGAEAEEGDVAARCQRPALADADDEGRAAPHLRLEGLGKRDRCAKVCAGTPTTLCDVDRCGSLIVMLLSYDQPNLARLMLEVAN